MIRTVWGHTCLWFLSAWIGALGVGCTSMFGPRGPSEQEIQGVIDRNNRNLLRLQTEMFEEYVFNIMGSPQRLEGYSWGTVWLYRTAATRGTQTTPETDFTPLIFDRRGVLLGWGRDFLATHRHRQSSIGREQRSPQPDQGYYACEVIREEWHGRSLL